MKTEKSLVMCILVMILFQTACYGDIGIKNGYDGVNTEMQNYERNAEDITKINLREYNEEKKKNIDVLLDQVENYPVDCAISDFDIKDEYTNFVLTSVDISDNDDKKAINARYRLKTNKNKDDYNARVTISFYDSISANHEVMRNSLYGYAAPDIYPSDLDIGDFAMGDIYHINYIRGNVFVTVSERPKDNVYEIEIDSLAREIDLQILDIINEHG